MLSEATAGGSKLRPSAAIVFRRVGDEAVLVPVQGEAATEGQLFALNEVGTFIWERIAEGIEAAEIARRLTEEFAVEEREALADVGTFVDELVAAGCLVPA